MDKIANMIEETSTERLSHFPKIKSLSQGLNPCTVDPELMPLAPHYEKI